MMGQCVGVGFDAISATLSHDKNDNYFPLAERNLISATYYPMPGNACITQHTLVEKITALNLQTVDAE